MRLEQCNILDCLTLEEFKSTFLTLRHLFPQYNISLEEPFTFTETLDNPHSKNLRDTEILKCRTAECGIIFELKNCNHINFNIKICFYQNKIYIDRGVYQYANYIADQLAGLLKNKNAEMQTYRQWSDEKFKKQESLVYHNYKIDKEDLAKFGLMV